MWPYTESDKLSSTVSRILYKKYQLRGKQGKASHGDALGKEGTTSAGEVHNVQLIRNPRENTINFFE